MRLLLLASVAITLVVTVYGGPQRSGSRGKTIGFTLENQFRDEENDGFGGVVGSYGVRTGDGCLRITKYKASTNGGFKVLSVRKEDCNPARHVSRVNPRPRPAPQATIKAVGQKSLPTSTSAPQAPEREIQQQSSSSPPQPIVVSTGRPLPPVILSEEPKGTKIKKAPTLQNKKPRRNNRPKQLKKDFDFDELKSNDNPARALDQKDDPVYSFGFTAPGHGHTQSGHEDGTKKGEYYFDSPDGWRRIVTYVATKKGFFPKMRRVRIPGWTSTTPAPRVSRTRGKQSGGDTVDQNNAGNNDLLGENGERTEGEGGNGGIGGKGGVGGEGGVGGRGNEDDTSGKQLLQQLQTRPGVGSCPYYFFYNTKVNFHWERCMENQTKVGQYGRLHEDGFSYRTSYYADNTGYHPTSTKVPLTPEQASIVHDFTEGVFILPKPDEERQQTEQRILDWLEANKDLLRDPLQPQ